MTAQFADAIKFEGRMFELAGEPLAFWLERRKNKGLRFRREHTGLSRGYVSSWEVAKGRLYLTKFSAHMADGTMATVDALFKNYSSQYLDSVKAVDPSNAGLGQFAFWLTATMRCPLGKLIDYKHDGYSSVRERDLMLEFRDGFLVGSRIIENDARRDRP